MAGELGADLLWRASCLGGDEAARPQMWDDPAAASRLSHGMF